MSKLRSRYPLWEAPNYFLQWPSFKIKRPILKNAWTERNERNNRKKKASNKAMIIEYEEVKITTKDLYGGNLSNQKYKDLMIQVPNL